MYNILNFVSPFNVFFSREECKFYDQLERIILKDRTSEGQDVSELESITDSDSGISHFNREI